MASHAKKLKAQKSSKRYDSLTPPYSPKQQPAHTGDQPHLNNATLGTVTGDIAQADTTVISSISVVRSGADSTAPIPKPETESGETHVNQPKGSSIILQDPSNLFLPYASRKDLYLSEDTTVHSTVPGPITCRNQPKDCGDVIGTLTQDPVMVEQMHRPQPTTPAVIDSTYHDNKLGKSVDIPSDYISIRQHPKVTEESLSKSVSSSNNTRSATEHVGIAPINTQGIEPENLQAKDPEVEGPLTSSIHEPISNGCEQPKSYFGSLNGTKIIGAPPEAPEPPDVPISHSFSTPEVLHTKPRPNISKFHQQNLSQTASGIRSSSIPQSPNLYPHPHTADHYIPGQNTGYSPRYPAQSMYHPSHSVYATPAMAGYPGVLPFQMQHQQSSPPHQPPYGMFNTPYGPYGSSPPRHHNSVQSRGSNTGDFRTFPPSAEDSFAIEDESSDLLSRVSSAIPDLHMLLSKYKEKYGQLSLREEALRRSQAQQLDVLKHKEELIETLTRQLDDAAKQKEELIKHYSSENSKLRLQVGNLEEKQRDLEERISAAEARRNWLEAAQDTLLRQKETLETSRSRLEKEKIQLEKAATEEKDRLLREFKISQKEASDNFESKRATLALEFDKKLTTNGERAEAEQRRLMEEHIKEKDTLRTKFQRQKREMEINFEKLRKGLEAQLDDAQKDLEDALKKEREARRSWSEEREGFIKKWEEERETLAQEYSEQHTLLITQYKKEKDDAQRVWIDLHAEFTKHAEEEKTDLITERNKLKAGWEEDKRNFDRVLRELRGVTRSLSSEKSRLQRMIDGFEEVSDFRGKGDAYYVNAFTQLCKQIIEFSSTYFTHMPLPPPKDVLSRIPSNIPSFLADTTASKHLRTAYVAHIISTIITYRIFTPFLFSLGSRYDNAESVLNSISTKLREKSTRKEAIWRHHTLAAAFTSKGARDHINAAAGSVADEIVEAVKPFTNPAYFNDPLKAETICNMIRRIVKLAAETWRFARLEREIIEAKMSDSDDEMETFWKGEGLWSPQLFDRTISCDTYFLTDSRKHAKREVLLKIFPVIRREAIHESHRSTGDKENDNGYIYNHGIALYSDAEPVRIRLVELLPEKKSAKTYPLPWKDISLLPKPLVVPSTPPETYGSLGRNLLLSIENDKDDDKEYGFNEKHSKLSTSTNSRTSSPKSPPSPLYPAVGEIDALKQKSVNKNTPKGPLDAETPRKGSVFSTNSRYRAYSQSAAIRVLYRNTSMPADSSLQKPLPILNKRRVST